MICELCGKDTDRTTTVFIEGTYLKVCKECQRFGKTPGTAVKKEVQARSQVAERLQARERRMRSRDVYEGETTTVDLVPDYPSRIRDARLARDWKQETLAAKINEKTSIISKLESGTIRPSDALIKKLEKELGIKLMDKVAVVKPEGQGSTKKGLTLGDFIKSE